MGSNPTEASMKQKINIPFVLQNAGGISWEAFEELCKYEDIVDPKPKRIIKSVWLPINPN